MKITQNILDTRDSIQNDVEYECSKTDLLEFLEFLVDRESTEIMVAEAHDTYPPQSWLDESQMWIKRVEDQLTYRRVEEATAERYFGSVS